MYSNGDGDLRSGGSETSAKGDGGLRSKASSSSEGSGDTMGESFRNDSSSLEEAESSRTWSGSSSSTLD